MTAFSSLPVREVVGDPSKDDHGWPFTMGAVRQLLRDGLELSELTILVGENGVGKSTIIEAIAMAYGLSPEGGSTHLGRVSQRSGSMGGIVDSCLVLLCSMTLRGPGSSR